MKTVRKTFSVFLCATAMLVNGLPAMAQSKEQPKSKNETRTFIFKGEDGQVQEVKGKAAWVGQDGNHFEMHVPAGVMHLQEGPASVEFISHEFSFDSKIVKGAPYTADAVTETIQVLGDGNRIVRRSSAQVSRDGEGRTRREQELSMIGPLAAAQDLPRMVYINDPVAGAHYTLNPKSRTARKMSVDRIVHTTDGKTATITSTSRGPGAVNVAVATTSGSEDFKFVTENNKTVVFTKKEDGESEDIRKKLARVRVDGPEAGEVFFFKRDGQPDTDRVKRESLGQQSFEGVMAEGTRTTITIPAGEIGNEQPIVTVYERWYSPELQTVVMTRRSDPRSGETIFKLMNINRSEPDPRMFQIPTDYTISETSEVKVRSRGIKE
ncbi:MAG: hypothetical protein IPM66_17145 [Acidobacteriota bacterium]|nr:MAG: hypothetical protein IPM66_17145 [Acidobacteriota bacterium]